MALGIKFTVQSELIIKEKVKRLTIFVREIKETRKTLREKITILVILNSAHVSIYTEELAYA